jgi:hypothetical protein
VPCTLIVGPKESETEIKISGSDTLFSERLEFPTEKGSKKDLNYLQIADQIKGLGINQSTLARSILTRMAGLNEDGATGDTAAFLNAMVALLFGVESSRNQATLATTPMLLDLISQSKFYGRNGNKAFTLSGAFNSSHGYHWDDGEYDGNGSLYGGKHPMAVHGTGSGNMGDRYAMTSTKPSDRKKIALAEIDTLNQRHAVPRREASLLVHWLEANVTSSSTHKTDEKWVEQAISARIARAYQGKPWILPGSPFADTGIHTQPTNRNHDGSLVNLNALFYLKTSNTYHKYKDCKLIPMPWREKLQVEKNPNLKIYPLCPYCGKK